MLSAKGKRARKKLNVNKRKEPSKSTTTVTPTLIDDKWDWNGSMFPFRGLNHKVEEQQQSQFDDSEWATEDDCWDDKEKSLESAEPKQISGLSLLMGAYEDDSDNDDEDKSHVDNMDVTMNDGSDGESPTEIKIDRQDNAQCAETVEVEERLQMQSRNSNNGEQEIVAARKDVQKESRRRCKTKQKPKQSAVYRKMRNPTLLEQLLKDEIRHERNVLLQCVRYVVNSNFFVKEV